jgi:hypothetical protein
MMSNNSKRREGGAMTDILVPVSGKSCGSCTMCCKVYDVPMLSKPAGKWCTHCKPGNGCSIWETRPDFCQSFFCRYMLDANLGPEWKPDLCKFVMSYQPNGTFAVTCDHGFRHAWKQEPYYSAIKRMALQLLNNGITLYVVDGVSKIIVTPDDDVVVGGINEDPNYSIFKVEKGPLVSWRVDVQRQAASA